MTKGRAVTFIRICQIGWTEGNSRSPFDFASKARWDRQGRLFTAVPRQAPRRAGTGGTCGTAGREGDTSGAKALIRRAVSARLKSCPDTKHEFFRSVHSHALRPESFSAGCKAVIALVLHGAI